MMCRPFFRWAISLLLSLDLVEGITELTAAEAKITNVTSAKKEAFIFGLVLE